MKELELFYLNSCPYCINARRAMDELVKETPAFGEIALRWIEEKQEPALAASRDYYYVPTLYFRGEKLYEAKIYLQTGDLLAWTAVIVALSALFERAVLALLRRCCRWAKGGRT